MRQFPPSECTEDTFRTIELTDGVKAVICNPKKCAIDLAKKSGRRLSQKSKSEIEAAITSLKTTIAVLEKLLSEDNGNPPNEDGEKPAGENAGQRSEQNHEAAIVMDRETLALLRSQLRANDKSNEIVLSLINKKLSN